MRLTLVKRSNLDVLTSGNKCAMASYISSYAKADTGFKATPRISIYGLTYGSISSTLHSMEALPHVEIVEIVDSSEEMIGIFQESGSYQGSNCTRNPQYGFTYGSTPRS